MSIEEDLQRAKEILAKGKPEAVFAWVPDETLRADLVRRMRRGGGMIYGADSYAAYQLLERFVAEIERLRASEADAFP
jgi:hypothetical protein